MTFWYFGEVESLLVKPHESSLLFCRTKLISSSLKTQLLSSMNQQHLLDDNTRSSNYCSRNNSCGTSSSHYNNNNSTCYNHHHHHYYHNHHDNRKKNHWSNNYTIHFPIHSFSTGSKYQYYTTLHNSATNSR